ncbi:pimeloyl-ACP methyl ester carboxylesterase [Kribbella voronezhensis]|uniref:Pimeloyl-ACP methyl ester carboxylesterase n=1 Tax=Kribbella voronezhensis TaxID=2512212 RepID=A0A4R7TE64_9ACTN|nr:alpha/beta hydrolase [Kribbella voronezhensis]TDU90461.1 pimeloyl-ACP methyl ester carboxylesterase [Kribbella voronezhensis]
MSASWIVLPGLAETPEEFDRVLELLPGRDVRVVDPWQIPVAAPLDELRAATTAGTPVCLAGHSIGGLAVLRWALVHPGEVERLVLIDTSLTSETGWSWLYPGTRADRMIRSFLTFVGRTGLPRLIGPTLRRLLVRVGSATNRDLLSKATARARYGAADSWLLFWDDLASSWTLAAEVAELLKDPPPDLPPTVFLVATGGSSRFTAKSWLAGQRELAAKLNTTGIEVLSDSAHLVHLDRPDAIAKALSD